MAEQQQIVVRPKVEMAQPELLVDQPQSFVNDGFLFVRNPNFRQQQNLENMIFISPDCAHLVACPVSLDLDGKLVIADMIDRPAARLEKRRQHIHGRRFVLFKLFPLVVKHSDFQILYN